MEHKGKKYFYYSAIALGMSGFLNVISATDNVQHDSIVDPHKLSSESVSSSENQGQSWGEWFQDLLEPFEKSAKAMSLVDAKQYFESPQGQADLAYTDLVGVLNAYKNQKITREQLEQDLQGVRTNVAYGLISLSSYLESIQAIKGISEKKERQKIFTIIKENPHLLANAFIQDLLNAAHDSTKSMGEIKHILHHYKQYQSPWAHLQSVSAVGRIIAQNKEAVAESAKDSGQRVTDLSATITEYFRKIQRKNPQFLNIAYQEHVELSAKLSENTNQEPSSNGFSGFVYEGSKLVYNGIQYAVNHPMQTLTTILAAQVAGTAALQTFSFGSGSITGSTVSAFKGDGQNRFLVAHSGGTGVEGQSFLPDGTADGSQFTITTWPSIQGSTSSLSNGSVPIGYFGTGGNYFMNLVSPGNNVGPSVQLTTATSGGLSSLKFIPLNGSNATIPEHTIHASWTRGGNGEATMVFSNATTLGAQIFGVAQSGESPFTDASALVFLKGSGTTIAGNKIGWGGSSFTYSNSQPGLCGGSGSSNAKSSMTPSGDILLACQNSGNVYTQKLSSTGVPQGTATNTFPNMGVLANIALPSGNALLVSNSTASYVTYTIDGTNYGPLVNVESSLSATGLANGNIATVANGTPGTGYILTSSDYNPSGPTPSPTGPTPTPTDPSPSPTGPTPSPTNPSPTGPTPGFNPPTDTPTTPTPAPEGPQPNSAWSGKSNFILTGLRALGII